MIFPVLKKLNRYLPESVRLSLLPYYRKLFPGLNNIIFIPQVACNYSCPYCIWNRFTPQEYKKAYHGWAEWHRVFDAFPPSAFTITGGEPFLYKDLVPLIERFPAKHLISCLVSNLELIDISAFGTLKRREFRIMASFHPSMTTEARFLERLLALKTAGFRNVTVNFVAYPEYLDRIREFKKYFETKSGFYFRVDTYKDPVREYRDDELSLVQELKSEGIIAPDRTDRYDFNDLSPKTCRGGSSYFIVIPNGNVYRCMEGYYYTECEPYKDKRGQGDDFFLGNVFDGSFKPLKKKGICHSPCAELCDIEMAGVRARSRSQ